MPTAGRRPAVVLALAGALLFSFLIFGTAPLLLRAHNNTDTPLPHSVPIFLPLRSTPPPEEEKQPPPEPMPPKVMKVTPLKVAPPPIPSPKLSRPVMDLTINPSLSLSPALDAPAPPQRALALGTPDRQPMLNRRVPPVYPYQARRRGLEGAVHVRFLVDAQGRVRKLQIIKADPPDVFDGAVRKSVSAWRFKPGTKQGRAVECWVETTIRFTLEER